MAETSPSHKHIFVLSTLTPTCFIFHRSYIKSPAQFEIQN